MRVLIVILFALEVAVLIGASPGNGKEAFEKRCSGCHELDRIRAAPRLRGVYGRKAAQDPEYPYSDALKGSAVVWNDETLDRWIVDTESVVPGNDMPYRLSDKDERARIIAYLKQLGTR